jgi:hypothetical protein
MFMVRSWPILAALGCSSANVDPSAIERDVAVQPLPDRAQDRVSTASPSPASPSPASPSPAAPSPAAPAPSAAPDVAPSSAGSGEPVALIADSGIVVGGLEQPQVRERLETARDQLLHCYRRALITDRAANGFVRLSFVVTEQGAVVTERGTNDVIIDAFDSRMATCIERAVGAIRFPSTKYMTDVTWGVYFKRPGNER